MSVFRTVGIAASGIAFFVPVTVAFAEDQPAITSVNAGTSVEASAEAKAQIEAKRLETKAQIEAKRQEVKAQVDAKRLEVKTNIDARRTDVKAQIEARGAMASTTQAEAKARMEAKRAETKAQMEAKRLETKAQMEARRAEVKANMEVKRMEAKQRLTEIRDKKKQERAVRLNEQFDKFNAKWTDQFAQSLDRYDAALVKIKARADIAATNGKDITTVIAAIASAESSIAAARAAVVAQAAKLYVLDTTAITATDPTTTSGQEELVSGVKTAFQDIHKSLFSDLTALRDGVMRGAREAVQAALQSLNQIPQVDDDESTSTDN